MSPKSLGKALARERLQRGLTTRAAGELAGLHHTTIVRLDRRGVGQSLAGVEAYARALGFRVELSLRPLHQP